MNKVLVILGPTATGKTDLAINIAKKLNGELVSCDSRQVYKDLDIGTGKLPGGKVSYQISTNKWIIDQIPVWMYDVSSPKDQYNVSDYIKDAVAVIKDILKRHKLPIIVGGTAYYLKGLLEGIPTLGIKIDTSLREELSTMSVIALQQKLSNMSPQAFEKMNDSDRANPRRLIRAIEIVTMYPYIAKDELLDKPLALQCEVLKIGLTTPRPILNQRIDNRLLTRLDMGLIEEGQKLLEEGLSFDRMRQLGLEYGQLADLLEGKINRVEFKSRLATKIHQYAKEQMGWFKKDLDINWFDISQSSFSLEVEALVLKWYDRPINVT